jgi:hypothetical protein
VNYRPGDRSHTALPHSYTDLWCPDRGRRPAADRPLKCNDAHVVPTTRRPHADRRAGAGKRRLVFHRSPIRLRSAGKFATIRVVSCSRSGAPPRWSRWSRLGSRLRPTGDEGSTIPLILGFFLIAMLFVAGATAISGAFTDQRDLQSVCDGATLAAANSATGQALHGAGNSGGAIALSIANEAIAEYLQRVGSGEVKATGQLAEDGMTVQLTCLRHTRLAFGSFIGKGDGIDQRATSAARSPLG